MGSEMNTGLAKPHYTREPEAQLDRSCEVVSGLYGAPSIDSCHLHDPHAPYAWTCPQFSDLAIHMAWAQVRKM